MPPGRRRIGDFLVYQPTHELLAAGGGVERAGVDPYDGASADVQGWRLEAGAGLAHLASGEGIVRIDAFGADARLLHRGADRVVELRRLGVQEALVAWRQAHVIGGGSPTGLEARTGARGVLGKRSGVSLDDDSGMRSARSDRAEVRGEGGPKLCDLPVDLRTLADAVTLMAMTGKLRHIASLQVIGEAGVVAPDRHRHEARVVVDAVDLASLAVGPRSVTLCAAGVVRTVVDVLVIEPLHAHVCLPPSNL
jgi:hypothetical protein